MRSAVYRVNNDGRREFHVGGLTAEFAEQVAGQLRDRMSDEDVGDGWTYEAESEHPNLLQMDRSRGLRGTR